jgi:hypothetical protein
MLEALSDIFEAEKIVRFFNVHGFDSVRRVLVDAVEAGSGEASVREVRTRMGNVRKVEGCIVRSF